MTIKRLMSGLLVGSLVLSALPARAESENGVPPVTQTSVASSLRESLDRAAASAALLPEASKGMPFRSTSRNLKRSSEFATEDRGGQGVAGGGGGMSVATLIMTLVGTAAGVGATVYMVKQLKKVESTGK